MPQNSYVQTPFGMAVQSPKAVTNTLAGQVIVQILPALNHGGVERGSVEMAEAIIRAGGRAIVISSGGLLETKLKRIGAEHYTVNVATKNPLKWMFARKQVKNILKAVGADLVHVRSRVPAWIALSAAEKLKVKTVSTLHGRFKAHNIFKRFYNSVMIRADRVIAISHYIEDLTLRQFPTVKDKMTVIHRGVDIDLFSPQAVTPQRVINISEQMMLPDGSPVVMLPSRPTGWKGMSVLVEAMGLLADRQFILVLLGAGDGHDDFLSQLTKQVDKAGLSNKCRINKSVTDMPAALMLADVVVMPSITPEPFGRVSIEASAMGCPVVAFAHGGAKESILHGKTGWLAEPVSKESLAEAIATALDLNQKDRQKLALRSQDFVAEHFSSDKMCQSTIDLYANLLKS